MGILADTKDPKRSDLHHSVNEREPSSLDGVQQDQATPKSPDALPHVTLPQGGGSIRGIGEKFSVNAVTGTSALSIPLGLSPGRSGFTPGLELNYDSGSGNGHFGFGWKLQGLLSITRKTDKGLPQYCDGDESDVFILAGSEDLVPILDANGARFHAPRTVSGIAYDVHLYRPRIEGLFSRIERWVNVKTGHAQNRPRAALCQPVGQQHGWQWSRDRIERHYGSLYQQQLHHGALRAHRTRVVGQHPLRVVLRVDQWGDRHW